MGEQAVGPVPGADFASRFERHGLLLSATDGSWVVPVLVLRQGVRTVEVEPTAGPDPRIRAGTEVVVRRPGLRSAQRSRVVRVDERSMLLATPDPVVDRRTLPRVPFHRPLTWQPVEPGSAPRPGTTEDLSMGGVRFLTWGEAPVLDRMVVLRFALSGDDAMHAIGRVLSVVPAFGRWRVRVRWEDPPDQTRARLARLVDDLSPPPPR